MARRRIFTRERGQGDSPLVWIVAYGPAVACVAWILARVGPEQGLALASVVAALAGAGVLGLSALTLAYLPATLELLGMARLAARLRRWWDRDAR